MPLSKRATRRAQGRAARGNTLIHRRASFSLHRMQDLTARLLAGAELSTGETELAVAALLAPDVADAAKADFLRALHAKGETAREIADFVRALLDRAVDPRLDPATLPGPVIDVCGTGGDKMEMFNISTAAMFVTAAAGAVVVKHGNRAITSKCGGADVLEELGVRIDLGPEEFRRCVAATGLGFLFAQHYHPAFKVVAPVRKHLAAEGTTTIFNMLGPLLNPARPPFQLTGVFSPMLVEKLAATLRALGRTKAWVLHGGGADEITPAEKTSVVAAAPAGLRAFEIDPAALGFAPCAFTDLRGGGRVENARTLTGILDGSIRDARRDAVLLNAAAALAVTGLAADIAQGVEMAREKIASGAALAKLKGLRDFSQRAP
jgi:anthranilate phosphoribosyltransferase